jgi:flagellar basal body-associated protein FliL
MYTGPERRQKPPERRSVGLALRDRLAIWLLIFAVIANAFGVTVAVVREQHDRHHARAANAVKLARQCTDLKRNASAIRTAIVGNADDLGQIVLQFAQHDHAVAQEFADELHQRAVKRAIASTRGIRC